MERVFSKDKVKAGSVIQMDDTNERYKVKSCINLDFFDRKGYQLNIVKLG